MSNKIQFNLLPDVKLSYIKSQRTRNLVISGAALATLASVVIFLLTLLSTGVVQRAQLNKVDKQIAEATTKLKGQQNLDQLLTIQNQLKTLVNLHGAKHITSRIFSYMPQVTPVNVSIGNLNLSFADGSMQIDGTADSQRTVNTFIDTLKFTTYSTGADNTPKNAFPTVVESSFSIGQNNVSYSLNVKFDPILFSNNTLDSTGHAVVPVLNVPKLTTTRAVSNDPANVLFNGQFKPPTNGAPR